MLRPWFDRLADALPARCEVCHAWPARPICRACAELVPVPARCGRCALPLPEGIAECGACVREPSALDACHAAVSYGFPWADLISRFKFRGEAGWARPLAGLMRKSPAIVAAVAAADRVLPMPLFRRRLAERGFNQAQELARQLAAAKLDAGLLRRVRDTAPQVALDRSHRGANVAGAFAVDPRRARLVHDAHLVLVDDVMTSGASLFEAARVLRQAGARRVVGVVLARTD